MVRQSVRNGSTNVTIAMGVLIGDVNGNGAVNASDVALTKSRSGQPVAAATFRSDVNANGSINAADVSLVKKKSQFSLVFACWRVTRSCSFGSWWMFDRLGTSLASFRPEVSSKASHRTLTFAERVAYQRAIEEVYWRHRIWPKERPDPKPSLDAVMSQAQIESKVQDYLRNSQALEDYWQRPITAEQLQAEMDRMAHHTKQPDVLRELFQALGNDPFVIAECLARPVLIERLPAHHAFEQVKETSRTFGHIEAATASYTLPTISDPTGGCTDDTWTATSLVNATTAASAHCSVDWQ